jgi:hypothetical protein
MAHLSKAAVTSRWDKNRGDTFYMAKPSIQPALHLFQELSTLGQQLAHTRLLLQGLGRSPYASKRVAPLFGAKWMANPAEEISLIN